MKNTYTVYCVDATGTQLARHDYSTKADALSSYRHWAEMLRERDESGMPAATAEVCLYVNEDQEMLASTSAKDEWHPYAG
jgi:hypothetical protein